MSSIFVFRIYVHQRGQEIETKKNQTNHWGNFGSSYPNGSARTGASPLAHPVSLSQEPNPITLKADDKRVANENNQNIEPKVVPKPTPILKDGPTNAQILNPNELLKPILEINGTISIPRVKLAPITTKPAKFDSNHDNKRYVSSLAKRSSYLEFERDPNKVPKRNLSYNIAQTSDTKPYSYDNKAFDSRTESDLYKPVLIKRASTRRTQM